MRYMRAYDLKKRTFSLSFYKTFFVKLYDINFNVLCNCMMLEINVCKDIIKIIIICLHSSFLMCFVRFLIYAVIFFQRFLWGYVWKLFCSWSTVKQWPCLVYFTFLFSISKKDSPPESETCRYLSMSANQS